MNRIHTPSDNLKVVQSLSPASRTASEDGAYVDTRGYTSALVVCEVGTHDRTTGNETFQFKIEEDADGSGAGTLITGLDTGALGNVVPEASIGNRYVFNVDLTKGGRLRYIRPTLTLAGTTPILLCGATVYLFGGKNPPTQPTGVTEYSD